VDGALIAISSSGRQLPRTAGEDWDAMIAASQAASLRAPRAMVR